jgi:hypothetical protein
MNNLKMFLKLIPAAIFVIGLDIIIPFSTFGLGFVQAHGKVLLFVIAIINAFIGGGISAGFLDKGIKSGFLYWKFPLSVDGELNPAYAFGGLSLVISVLWTLLIQP